MKKLFVILFGLGLAGIAQAQINPTNNCGVAVNTLPVNASCVVNNYTMAGSFTNSGINSGCGSSTNRDDGFYQFTTPAGVTAVTIDETSCTGSNDRRRVLAVYTGSCGTGLISCVENVSCVQNTLNLTGLTPLTTYYIQLDRTQGGSTATMTGTICVYETPNADVAFPGLDLGTLACTSTTTRIGNTTGATQDCGASSAGDHTYQFTTTSISDIQIDLCGSSYDTEVHVFNLADASCDGVPFATNDDGCGVQSSLLMACAPAGSYVIVIEGSGAAEGNYDMDINISNCGCTNPTNDVPCTATALAVNTNCVKTLDNNTGATDSGIANPGCANYGGADLWYTVTVPASGALHIETFSVSGGITDGGLAAYSGVSCAALTLVQCNDDGGEGTMEQINLTGLTPGSTIWIRVWEYGGNFEGELEICVYDPTCSGLSTNDFCEDPGILTADPAATFSSSTTGIYTEDLPGNIASEFCGSIENNSWYMFTAGNTTETFDIITVANCTQGIQAEVYDYGFTGSCCSGFSSVSNCFSPGSNTTGTVTATGLTVGNDYILMIDGFANAQCDFTIDNWSATNVLPVVMHEFTVDARVDQNFLKWNTKSEADSRWFVIERSFDGENFTEIGKVDAAGNSSVEQHYEFVDEDFAYPFVYYRLKMVDIDMTYEYSHIRKVEREINTIDFHPNPTNGQLNITFGDHLKGDFEITYTDVLGKVVSERVFIGGFQTTHTSDVLVNLPSGIYFVEITDSYGNSVQVQKVIRN